MKNKRTLLFQLGAVLLLIIIAGIMMMIGRGHTVYMDNVTMDYNGQTYESFYKVEVYVDGERIGKLYDKERAMSVNIGQTFDVSFEVTPNKGDSVMVYNVSLSLPYNMDGITCRPIWQDFPRMPSSPSLFPRWRRPRRKRKPRWMSLELAEIFKNREKIINKKEGSPAKCQRTFFFYVCPCPTPLRLCDGV